MADIEQVIERDVEWLRYHAEHAIMPREERERYKRIVEALSRKTDVTPEMTALLDMVDELYRKYGVELDNEDVAIAQAARNLAMESAKTP